MIDQSDIAVAKALIEYDEWLNLIFFMQEKKQHIQFTPKEIIRKIDSVFKKMTLQTNTLISINLNQIDKIIKKQYSNPQYISADIGEQYYSELGSFS